MKIAWISHDAGLAGASISLVEAARGIVARGHSIHVVVPSRGALSEALDALPSVTVGVAPSPWWVGAQPRPSSLARAKRGVRIALACRELRAMLRANRPDLVVSNTLAIPTGAIVARLLRLPHVWYIHEMFGKEGHDLYFTFGERWSLARMARWSSSILVNSHTVRRQFAPHVAGEKLRVVYYAVEMGALDARRSMLDAGIREEGSLTPSVPTSSVEHRASSVERAEGAFRLVYVARVTPNKRQEDAVRAVGVLAERGVPVHLALVGDADPVYGERLRRLAVELGVGARVELVPFTADPFARVAAADVALMPSRGEAFGRVTIEAMKLGKPVVGAESGGTAELIAHGENGLLHPLGDAAALATQVEVLYRDRAKLMTMGEQAKEWAHATCNAERYTDVLLSVFEEVIHGYSGDRDRDVEQPR